jgi:hypothetical protein
MRMRDVVDLVTSEPPPPRYTVDEIVASGQRVRHRRRLARVASGATAVVALGVAAAVAVPSLTRGAPVPTAAASPAVATHAFPVSGEPFTFTFSGYRVGALRVGQPVDVSTAYQLAPVSADGTSTYAYLAVYRSGGYDPAKLAGARPVTVAGRPGLEASRTGGPWAVTRTLAWQYGTDAWAVFTVNSSDADHPSAADLRRLAAGLPAATPAVAKVPVTMSYVPSGYRLNEVGVHAMTGLNGIAAVAEGDHAGLLFSRPALPATGLTEPFGGVDGADPPGSFLIFVVPAANSNQHPSPGVTCGHGFCNRWAEGGRVNLQVASGGRLPDSEMRKILDGITLGNVHDDSTWTPVTTAVPAG